MANPTADIRRLFGETSAERARLRSGHCERARFGPTLALTVTLAFACFAVVMSLVLLVHPPTRLPGDLGANLGDQNRGTKTALYLSAFAVILPLALVAAPRLADTIAAGPNAPALSALAGHLAATLAATILVVRLSGLLPWGDGMGVVLGAVGIWWVGAAAMLARAAQPRPWSRLLRLAGSPRVAWVMAGVLVLGTLLCLTSLKSLSPLPLGLGAVAVASVIVVHERRRRPRLPRSWGTGIDVVIAVIVLLAIPDLVIFRPGPLPASLFSETGVIQFHQNFLLGPANQVLGGDAMLVDTASQYGVGSIYLLAGWFHLAPIGYGTLGFLDGALTALFYVAAYCLLRVAGSSRLLAASALAVGVIALVYNLHYSVGAIPQQGPLRFGLPMAVILATVVGARWPCRARAARAAALVVVGVASIWALEAFAYTVAAFVAMAFLQAWLLPAERRLPWLTRQAAQAAAACLCAHLVLAGATLAATGELPDWGQYLAYLNAFLSGRAGELTYGFSRWSPGLAVGAAYLASAAAIVLLVRRQAGIVQRERTALIALSGTTGYGIALFSYFDNRSATFLLPYVALPALLAGTLWLSLLLRSPRNVSRGTRVGGLAFGLSVAVLLLAVAWSSVGDRFPRSALAHALPGGEPLGAALHRLWHPPPLDPRAPEGVRLLDRYIPGERRTLILIMKPPDLGTEILIRSGRANELPLGDPVEDSFAPSARLPGLRQAVAKLRPGDRLLMDQTAQEVLATLRAHPSIDPLAPASGLQAPLQGWVLKRIGERFQLQPIHRGKPGFIVAQLVPRT